MSWWILSLVGGPQRVIVFSFSFLESNSRCRFLCILSLNDENNYCRLQLICKFYYFYCAISCVNQQIGIVVSHGFCPLPEARVGLIPIPFPFPFPILVPIVGQMPLMELDRRYLERPRWPRSLTRAQ